MSTRGSRAWHSPLDIALDQLTGYILSVYCQQCHGGGVRITFTTGDSNDTSVRSGAGFNPFCVGVNLRRLLIEQQQQCEEHRWPKCDRICDPPSGSDTNRQQPDLSGEGHSGGSD